MAAPEGNKYTQKYTEEEAVGLFLEMLDYSKTDDCLCVQDAFLHIELPSSTFFYLANKYKVLESIKKDIMANVISKVNRGSLKGDLNSTAAIWRMKQLGETDKTEVNSTVTNLTPPTPEELKKASEELDETI